MGAVARIPKPWWFTASFRATSLWGCLLPTISVRFLAGEASRVHRMSLALVLPSLAASFPVCCPFTDVAGPVPVAAQPGPSVTSTPPCVVGCPAAGGWWRPPRGPTKPCLPGGLGHRREGPSASSRPSTFSSRAFSALPLKQLPLKQHCLALASQAAYQSVPLSCCLRPLSVKSHPQSCHPVGR